MPTVRLDSGLRIGFESSGAGEPVVLIPGTGQSGALWAGQVAVFRSRYRCLTIDNRGTGASDAPVDGYTIRQMADDVAELLMLLGIARAHIVGQSMGAAIGQELAIHYPGLVQTLQLHSTWDCTALYPHLERQLTLRRELARRELWDLFALNSPLWLFPPDYVNIHADELREREQLLFSHHPPAHVLVGHFQADIDYDARNRLNRIMAPTLVTYGDLDAITLPDYNQAVIRQIPSALSHVFVGAGHLPFSQYPEEFNEVSLAFLAAHPLPV